MLSGEFIWFPFSHYSVTSVSTKSSGWKPTSFRESSAQEGPVIGWTTGRSTVWCVCRPLLCILYAVFVWNPSFSIQLYSLPHGERRSSCRLIRQMIWFSSGGCEGKSSGLQQRFGLWRDRGGGKLFHHPSFFQYYPFQLLHPFIPCQTLSSRSVPPATNQMRSTAW